MPLIETLPVRPGVAQWPVWSTTARIVTTDPDRVEMARGIVVPLLDAVDAVASRFRPDSEIIRLAAAGGRAVRVSALLAELLEVALRAARDTDGAVDPSLGVALSTLGYDQSFEGVRRFSLGRQAVAVQRRHDWREVSLVGREVTVPPGMLLDLGATAKAWTADQCANRAVAELRGGVLVALGGDIAVAGAAPDGGWPVLVQDGPDEPASVVSLAGPGGIATSSTLARAWRRWNQRLHHIVDPQTCRPASPIWRTVSISAPSCLEANVLATQAIVLGKGALDLLRERRLPARLVGADGAVHLLNGWPAT
jgi:thiamine biosynthesis lipoprotein